MITSVQTLASEDSCCSALCAVTELDSSSAPTDHCWQPQRQQAFFLFFFTFSRRARLWRPGRRMRRMLGRFPWKENVRWDVENVEKAENTAGGDAFVSQTFGIQPFLHILWSIYSSEQSTLAFTFIHRAVTVRGRHTFHSLCSHIFPGFLLSSEAAVAIRSAC